MAKIIKNKDGIISIGTDDGGILEVTFDDLDFIPNVGDKVEVFSSESKTIVNKVEKNAISDKYEKRINNKSCFILGIFSFLLGVFFIFANYYWLFYGFAFIILAILDLIFYKNRTYLTVAGMLYLVLALFSLITIPSQSGKYFVLIIFVIYSVVFLIYGFKKVK